MDQKRMKVLWLLGAAIWLAGCGVGDTEVPVEERAVESGSDREYLEEQVFESLHSQAKEEQFEFRMETAPVFSERTGEGTLALQNPPTNPYSCRVEIRLEQTGELLYDSGILKPNEVVNKAVLEKELESGTYAAYAEVSLYGEQEKKIGAPLLIDMRITVEHEE